MPLEMSAAACSRCDYRVNCSSFWAAVEPSWVEDGIFALSGVVISAVDTGALVGLRVLADAGTVTGEVTIESLPRERVGDIVNLRGTRVAIDGLMRKRESMSIVRASHRSTFERLSAEEA